jgi:hypothetical protein
MSLSFPNVSRSYDTGSRRIRFSGYDGINEIRFFLELSALTKAADSKMSGEKEYLAAFDRARQVILATARKIYGKQRNASMCTLTDQDFG